MDPSWAPASTGSARTAWSEILCPLAAEMHDQARALSDSIVPRLRATMPAVFGDPASAEQYRVSAEGLIDRIAESIAAGSDPRMIELPPFMLAGAQDRARGGVPVMAMMRGFWLGREVLWEWTHAEISRRAMSHEALEAAVALCSAWLYEAIDAASTIVSEVYDVERERWLRTAAATRTETIEAILAERERDTNRASIRLRYELGRNHVAFVAWLREAESHEHREAAIAQIAQALGADGSLVEPVGLLTSRVWISRSAPFEESALEAVRMHPGTLGPVSVALGEPGAGVEGFRRSFFEASHARRVALLLNKAPGTVTRFAGVELTAVATADVELARLFANRTLGKLALDDDATRRIAATVKVYLEESCSRARTAKRLGIHSNTVGYRVRQAEATLGHPVEANATKLTVALTLLPTLGALTRSEGSTPGM